MKVRHSRRFPIRSSVCPSGMQQGDPEIWRQRLPRRPFCLFQFNRALPHVALSFPLQNLMSGCGSESSRRIDRPTGKHNPTLHRP